VAGPSLAYWLGRQGFEVTVVEIAPALRQGGYAVDFRGETHRQVLSRMALVTQLESIATGGSPMRFVDAGGRLIFRLPGEFAGGELEVLRADLSRVLYEHSREHADYVFGDTITSLTETPSGVDVTFRAGAARTFDLVVGADGLHSVVRRLAFGPEDLFVSHLGYHLASWDLPTAPDGEPVHHNEPGRMVGMGPRGAFAVFASPRFDYDRHDTNAQKALVRQALAGMGWQTPALLATLDGVDDLYFDSISRVDVSPWSRGRVALLGDAAHGATLGGMGTGTAVVGAYVLAGELVAAAGDYRAAYTRYEATLSGYARRCQKGGDRAGRFLAPRSRLGLRLRDRMLATGFVLDWLIKAGQEVSSDLALPDYPALRGAATFLAP